MLGVAPCSALVIDTNTKLTAPRARALYADGVRTVVRYAPLPGNSAAGDLDVLELASLTGAGHAVVLIQHPRSPGNNWLDPAVGAADVAHLLEHAAAIGYTPPATLAIDIEGVLSGSDVRGYASAAVSAILAAGFRALVYVGYAPNLTAAQCNALAALGDVRFWCDAGAYSARPAPAIGYAWKQQLQSTIAGVDVDRNNVLQAGVIYGMASVTYATDPGDPDPHLDPSGPSIPVPSTAHHDTDPSPAQ